MSEQMTTNANGGKQHSVDHRCEALFFRSLLEIARLRKEGFEKHGYEDENYQKIPARVHVGRALRHLFLWMIGDKEDGSVDEHLVHAGCRVLMALEMMLIQRELANGETDFLQEVFKG